MRNLRPATHRINRPAERGVVLLVLLYALSIFSVLALTLIGNVQLESRFRSDQDPELHVVVYTGGAGSPKLVGRLNLPRVFDEPSLPDKAVEFQTPAPDMFDVKSDLPPGWAYAINVAPGVRVCCDGADGACSALNPERQLPTASLNPPFEPPTKTTESDKVLRFELTAVNVPDNVTLDNNVAVESGFLVKAKRVLDNAEPPQAEQTHPALACRLDASGSTLATAALQLKTGTDDAGRLNRVSSGTLELSYRTPVDPKNGTGPLK